MKKTGLLILLLAMALAGSSAMANVKGAIFTTDSTCQVVNGNTQYETKLDVYLDGGPQHHEGAAGLTDGPYYVQVTSPSGEVLLGSSTLKSPPATVQVNGGEFVQCYQLWAILQDPNGSPGYANTPNPGGVYKVWVTPVGEFKPGQGVHGFIHDESKTDNFKVKGQGPCPDPSKITVLKFDDSNANSQQDDDEDNIDDWPINITDPLGNQIPKDTPVIVLTSPAGTWEVCEEILSGWQQTSLFVDGVKIEPKTSCVSLNVISDCAEEHTVIFGNIQLGSITACKFYDRNGNGVNNQEPPVADINFVLEGNDVTGSHIYQVKATSSNGCVTFDGLLPGDYNLCEILPPDGPDIHWVATTDACKLNIKLAEGDEKSFEFGNVCTGKADFDTKGYWHNKNGLNETVQADFGYLNTLAPWNPPFPKWDVFGAIDGNYTDGKPVPAAKDVSGKTIIAPAGSAKAEQSLFLVYTNAGGDPTTQLAQQLDAFIMNVRHRLGSPGVVILKPDGTWIAASQLITDAVNLWLSGSTAQRTAMSALLDSLNNSNAVLLIHETPCEVSYPPEP